MVTGIGSTAPEHEGVLKLRQLARDEFHAAEAPSDPDALWHECGAWIPPDDPQRAVAEARRLLPHRTKALVNWFPPDAEVSECARVIVFDVEDRSTGSDDRPWMRVRWQDDVLGGMTFASIGVVLRCPNRSAS